MPANNETRQQSVCDRRGLDTLARAYRTAACELWASGLLDRARLVAAVCDARVGLSVSAAETGGPLPAADGDRRGHRARSSGCSAYHLVGECDGLRRYVETERLGGLGIEDEPELGRLLHRKISGLLSAQNTVDVSRCLSQ